MVANLSINDIVDIAVSLTNPDEPDRGGCLSPGEAEQRLAEWTASLPEPRGHTGPAPNC